jgi:hypothetical protein
LLQGSVVATVSAGCPQSARGLISPPNLRRTDGMAEPGHHSRRRQRAADIAGCMPLVKKSIAGRIRGGATPNVEMDTW